MKRASHHQEVFLFSCHSQCGGVKSDHDVTEFGMTSVNEEYTRKQIRFTSSSGSTLIFKMHLKFILLLLLYIIYIRIQMVFDGSGALRHSSDIYFVLDKILCSFTFIVSHLFLTPPCLYEEISLQQYCPKAFRRQSSKTTDRE